MEVVQLSKRNRSSKTSVLMLNSEGGSPLWSGPVSDKNTRRGRGSLEVRLASRCWILEEWRKRESGGLVADGVEEEGGC